MSMSRNARFVLGAGGALLLAVVVTGGAGASAQGQARGAAAGNPITGQGYSNPTPVVTKNWGQLPAGRKWGTTAGIDIDPTDGQVVAYERCGAGAGGG
ncbi:MAG: hypothetical protein ABL982_01775, partial [Vicinamibacterales bacterium]